MMFDKCPYCKSDNLDYNVEPRGTTDVWHCMDCNTFLEWVDYAP
jgi:ribosomal protein L37AE/L43A